MIPVHRYGRPKKCPQKVANFLTTKSLLQTKMIVKKEVPMVIANVKTRVNSMIYLIFIQLINIFFH